MYFFILKHLATKGSSINRAYLDYHLKKEYLKGSVLDLGAGKQDMYSAFIPRDEGATYVCFDNKQGGKQIDFEKDPLPYNDGEFDTVVLLNVLEHLYNYKNILREIKRVKCDRLVGSVPFIK